MRVRLIQLFTILGLLLLIETVSYFSLAQDDRIRGFLINFRLIRTQGSYVHLNGFGFDRIDPFLGWSRTDSSILRRGFAIKNNCIFLKSSRRLPDCPPLRILITGGSTTDLALNKENWPIHLHEILEQKNISADIYVGSMGGYNSGQELLKLIQDGDSIHPDIHISYSGANDVSPDYVSYYESDLFENIYNSSNSSILLPNTIYVLKRLLGLSAPLYLKQYPDDGTIRSFGFWRKNMIMMHGIAQANKYTFVGILQPVLGVGKHVQEREYKAYKDNIACYKDYYPPAIAFADSNNEFLANMTEVFDSCTARTYVDDCHLTDPYQTFVANRIFELLKERNLTTER